MEPIIIRMPFLKCGENPEKYARMRRLNPGLSEKRLNMPAGNFFTPEMPFSPRQADQMLCEMLAFLDNGGEFPHGLDPAAQLEEMALREELAAIAEFAGKARGLENEAAMENALKRAQTLLLWRFALEELGEEISSLEQRLLSQEASLRKILSPECEGEGAFYNEEWRELPWWPVLKNAACFLPAKAAVFLEGSMARDISGSLRFQPVEEGFFSLENISGAYAALEDFPEPLPGKWRQSPLAKFFSAKRWWIIPNE